MDTAQSPAPTVPGVPYALNNYLLNRSVSCPESVSVWPQNPTGKPQPANKPRRPEATGTAGRGLGGGATASASPRLRWRHPLAQLQGVQGSGFPRGRPQSHAWSSALRPTGDLENSAGPAQPNARPRDPTLTCTSPAAQLRPLHPGDANFRPLTEAEI